VLSFEPHKITEYLEKALPTQSQVVVT